MGRLWIGTSGYSYEHWKNGVFYPKGLPSGRWFEFYAERFPTVELNVTFYRLPKPEVFKGWHRKAPAGFRFFVKGSRYITHIKRLKDPAPSLKKFYGVVRPLKEKLAGVLWQLPPGFKEDRERLAGFLEALRRYPGVPQAFEFRDPSWFNRKTAELMRQAGAAICRADGKHSYAGPEAPDTAPFVYIRRHGPPAAAGRLPEYSPRQIARDAREIRVWLQKGKEVFIYYNNDGGGAAVRNAKELQDVVAPFMGPDKRYATLR